MATVTLTGWVTYSDGTQQPFAQTFPVPGALPDGAMPTQAQVQFSSIAQDPPPPPPPPANFSLTPGQQFVANAWLYNRLADNAPLDPNSALVSKTLSDGLLAAATTIYWYADYPIYVVGADVPTCTVIVGTVNPDGTISRAANQVDLQPGFNAVPIPNPATLVTQQGTDHELVIYQPSSGKMWEGWLWGKTGRKTIDSSGASVDEWSIQWGGYEPNLATNPGWWSTLQPSGANQGAVAAGIPIVAFAITVADIRRQQINHAIGMVIPEAVNRYGWQSPAQRTDGAQSGTQFPQEGMIFRLPANIDLSAYPATQWDGVSPKSLWRLIAEAMRDYGLVIYDQGANAVMIGEAGATPQYATDPYQADPACQAALGYNTAGDYSYYAISDFPWSQMQLLAPLS